MTVEKLKDELRQKKSYFKKGKAWLSEKYGVSIGDVEKAFTELRQEKKSYVKSNPSRTGKLSFFKELMLPKDSFKQPKKSKPKPKVFSENNVLVIGDLHEPFSLDGYLDHCIETYKEFNCNKVIFIGDLIDNHAISYHEHDPDGQSPFGEYMLAVERLKRWYQAFPEAKVTIGNHDQLGVRKVFSAGLPSFWLKSLEQILEAPKSYEFDFHFTIDDVFYTHGTGVSGDNGAMKIANQNRQSAVIGHLHSVSNIKYSASYKDLIFAMTVGCGIDYKQYAFNYGKDIPAKPIVSCGVVLGGKIPVLVPMQL